MNRDALLANTRQLCLALPATTERLSHGQPAWFVSDKKQFVVYLDHHHGDHAPRLWCAAPSGAQTSLVASDPARFFKPPYVGTRGWLGVYLREPEEWSEIAGYIQEAYRAVAPRRLIAELDHRAEGEAQ